MISKKNYRDDTWHLNLFYCHKFSGPYTTYMVGSHTWGVFWRIFDKHHRLYGFSRICTCGNWNVNNKCLRTFKRNKR